MIKEPSSKACRWIAEFLHSTKGIDEAATFTSVKAAGIRSLKVPQLKLIARRLQSLPQLTRQDGRQLPEYPSTKSKKEAWVRFCEGFFFIDEECTKPVKDEDPIWTLLNASQETSQSVGAHSNERGLQQPSISRPAHDASQQNPSHLLGNIMYPNGWVPNFSLPPYAGYFPYPGYAPVMGFQPPYASRLPPSPVPPAGYDHKSNNGGNHKRPISQISHTPSNRRKIPSPINVDNDSHIDVTAQEVKQEEDEDILWETKPKSSQERFMLTELKHMGFTDDREILAGIRHVTLNKSTATNNEARIDAAMMWIVSQREETEEAKKLDEARISSEVAEEDRAKSHGEAEKQLESAPVADVLGKGDCPPVYFAESVLLQSRRARETLRTSMALSKECKVHILRLLSLEKKARKWYGAVVPWAYFTRVVRPQLEVDRSSPLTVSTLASMTKKLEKCMYELGEQQDTGLGSVPKAFLDAQDDAKCSGEPHVPTTAKEDVEIVDGANSAKACKLGAEKVSAIKVPAPDVIELV